MSRKRDYARIGDVTFTDDAATNIAKYVKNTRTATYFAMVLAIFAAIAAIVSYGLLFGIVNKEVQNNKEAIALLNTELDQTNMMVDMVKSDLNQTKADLNATNDMLNMVKQDLNMTQMDLAQTQSELAETQSIIIDIQLNITILRELITANELMINMTKDALQALTSNVTDNAAKNSDQDTEIDALETMQNMIKSDVSALQNTTSTQQMDIDMNKAEILELQILTNQTGAGVSLFTNISIVGNPTCALYNENCTYIFNTELWDDADYFDANVHYERVYIPEDGRYAIGWRSFQLFDNPPTNQQFDYVINFFNNASLPYNAGFPSCTFGSDFYAVGSTTKAVSAGYCEVELRRDYGNYLTVNLVSFGVVDTPTFTNNHFTVRRIGDMTGPGIGF